MTLSATFVGESPMRKASRFEEAKQPYTDTERDMS